jgi:hypothetical protein
MHFTYWGILKLHKNLGVFGYVLLFGDLSDALFVGIFFRLKLFGLYPGQAINNQKNE